MSGPVLTAKTPVSQPSSTPTSFVSDRHANPMFGGAQVKRENFGWAAVLAIITTLIFVVLLAMQYLDYDKMQTSGLF